MFLGHLHHCKQQAVISWLTKIMLYPSVFDFAVSSHPAPSIDMADGLQAAVIAMHVLCILPAHNMGWQHSHLSVVEVQRARG